MLDEIQGRMKIIVQGVGLGGGYFFYEEVYKSQMFPKNRSRGVGANQNKEMDVNFRLNLGVLYNCKNPRNKRSGG